MLSLKMILMMMVQLKKLKTRDILNLIFKLKILDHFYIYLRETKIVRLLYQITLFISISSIGKPKNLD